MQISIGKVVGTPTKKVWAQVHEFTPAEEEKLQKRGRLVAVLSFKEAPEGIEAVASGREILSRLHEEYFGTNEQSPFEALKSACNKLLAEFPHFGIEIVACVSWQEFVYFVAADYGEVYLWRDSQLVKLLAGSKDEVSSLSGNPKTGDVFLFGTRDVFGNINPKLLQELLSKNTDPKMLADSLVPLMHKDESASQALAVVGFEEKSEEADVAESENQEVTAPKSRFKLPKMGIERVKNILHIFASKLSERNVYIERRSTEDMGGRRKRTMISIGVVLIVLLGASIFFGFRQKNLLNFRASYESRLVEAETAYSDSLLQKDANPGQARELFAKSQNLVGGLVSEGIKDKRIDELSRKLEQNKVAVLGKVEANATVLRDLSILRSDITAAQMALHKGSMGILDVGGKRVIVSSTDGKETTVIGGPEKLGLPRQIAVYADRYFVLGDRGVVELDRKGAAKVVVQPDSQWGEIAGMVAFGGNIYLVDKGGQIWRYSAADAGFGTKQEWFGKGVTPDLSKTIDAAIDGSIWLLSSSGKVSKFTRGAPDTFSISGVSDGIVSPAALYTDENLDSIFILDKSAGKIVEISKRGEYQKQYVAEDLKQARDFVVAQGKIIVLTETKLLEIGLK